MRKPKVSIIVPVYNVEEYIDECLNSLVNQTLNNIEIIVVNDGSPDNSVDIVNQYLQKHPNIVLINQENGGLSKARNTGLKAATGEYIFFTDSDDYLPYNALEVMYNRAINDDSELVIGAIKNVTSHGISSNIHRMFSTDRITSFEEFPIVSENLGVSNKLYKRSLIYNNSLFFNEERKNCEDIPFSFAAYVFANKISIVKDCIYYYRRRQGSITSSIKMDFIYNFYLSMSEAKQLIKKYKKEHYDKIIRTIEKKEIIDIIWFSLLVLSDLNSESNQLTFKKILSSWLKECSERKILSPLGLSIVKLLENTELHHTTLVNILRSINEVKNITRKDLTCNNEKRNITYRDVFEKVIDFEKKTNLFSQKIKNIYYWRLIRYEVIEEIQRGLLGHQRANSKRNNQMKKQYIKRRELSSFGNYHKDIIIIDHLRKDLIEGKYKDFRTVEIIKELDDKKLSFEVIELPYDGKHYIVANDNRKYLDDYLAFIHDFEYKLQINFTTEEKEKINKIHDFILGEFNCNINLEDIIKRRMQNFIAEYLFFLKLLKIRKAKLLFIVGEAWFSGAIHAAKTLGIKTCGIQYALTGKYHPAFDYPEEVEVPYYPEKLILWGPYWHQTCNLPVTDRNIFYIPHSVLRARLMNLKLYKRNNRNILFISQGTVRDKLFNIALQFARSNPDYSVKYKLHPKESLTEYQITQSSMTDNMEIIEKHDNYDLYEQCEYLVGVYSTCIYEGIAAGCKIILVNLPGVELFEHLLDRHAELINDATELEITVRSEWRKESLSLELLFPNKKTYEEVIKL